MLGQFSPADGSVEFYSRINALLQPEFTVLDLGAGRGAWYFDKSAQYRKTLRTMKGKVARCIGADVDQAVLTNPATDQNVIITNGIVPLPDGSVDLIICDFVVEHIVDVASFKSEVNRLLKPGGFFLRTDAAQGKLF
jgi:SAM-dependent methyltransferase